MTTSFNLDELLARSKELLSKDQPLKHHYYLPRRAFVFSEFLVPEGPREYRIWEMKHVYYEKNGSISYLINEDRTPEDTIVHGHGRHELCYSGSYCHLSTYKPTGSESPAFLKQFQMKWGNIK
jgi:hypothetical protein